MTEIDKTGIDKLVKGIEVSGFKVSLALGGRDSYFVRKRAEDGKYDKDDVEVFDSLEEALSRVGVAEVDVDVIKKSI